MKKYLPGDEIKIRPEILIRISQPIELDEELMEYEIEQIINSILILAREIPNDHKKEKLIKLN